MSSLQARIGLFVRQRPDFVRRLVWLAIGIVLLIIIVPEIIYYFDADKPDPDLAQYEPLPESLTRTGRRCLSGSRFPTRLLPTMTSVGEDSDIQSGKTLVLYNYYETARAKRNLEFLMDHGFFIRPDVDWLFVSNSPHMCIDFPNDPSVGIIFRNNTCFDLGTFKEVILRYGLEKKYGRVLMMNGSIRGPFLPTWSKECWLDRVTHLLQGNVKAVSTTVNCQQMYLTWKVGWRGKQKGRRVHRPHMQSMFLALDKDAILPIIHLYRCFEDKQDAIWEGEIRNIIRLQQHNYSIVSLYSEFANDTKYSWDNCTHWGPDVHPYEVLFAKVGSIKLPELVDAVTDSVNARETRSSQYCSSNTVHTKDATEIDWLNDMPQKEHTEHEKG